jgi:drug/metabolite transporter (DMT)-like permease
LKKSWLPLSAVVLGILWMLAGGVAFTIMGALIKHLSQTLPITVIVFFQMLIAFVLLLPWILRERLTPVVTSRPGLHVVRSTTGFLSFMCLVYSLSRLDLADAVAISFTTPLWMIITAAVLLGESSGRRRWLATAIGFGGVLVIVRPDMDPDPAMLAALASAGRC